LDDLRQFFGGLKYIWPKKSYSLLCYNRVIDASYKVRCKNANRLKSL